MGEPVQELFEQRSKESWNYQTEWESMLSANEWILVPSDHQGPGIPMECALRLLVDHFGAERLHVLIDEASR